MNCHHSLCLKILLFWTITTRMDTLAANGQPLGMFMSPFDQELQAKHSLEMNSLPRPPRLKALEVTSSEETITFQPPQPFHHHLQQQHHPHNPHHNHGGGRNLRNKNYDRPPRNRFHAHEAKMQQPPPPPPFHRNRDHHDRPPPPPQFNSPNYGNMTTRKRNTHHHRNQNPFYSPVPLTFPSNAMRTMDSFAVPRGVPQPSNLPQPPPPPPSLPPTSRPQFMSQQPSAHFSTTTSTLSYSLQPDASGTEQNLVPAKKTKVVRHVSVFVAPHKPKNSQRPKIRVQGDSEKHVNIIFIKSPATAQQSMEMELPPNPEQKTLVYVLNKEQDGMGEVIVNKPETPKYSPPSVYFINYKDENGLPNLDQIGELTSIGTQEKETDTAPGQQDSQASVSAEPRRGQVKQRQKQQTQPSVAPAHRQGQLPQETEQQQQGQAGFPSDQRRGNIQRLQQQQGQHRQQQQQQQGQHQQKQQLQQDMFQQQQQQQHQQFLRQKYPQQQEQGGQGITSSNQRQGQTPQRRRPVQVMGQRGQSDIPTGQRRSQQLQTQGQPDIPQQRSAQDSQRKKQQGQDFPSYQRRGQQGIPSDETQLSQLGDIQDLNEKMQQSQDPTDLPSPEDGGDDQPIQGEDNKAQDIPSAQLQSQLPQQQPQDVASGQRPGPDTIQQPQQNEDFQSGQQNSQDLLQDKQQNQSKSDSKLKNAQGQGPVYRGKIESDQQQGQVPQKQKQPPSDLSSQQSGGLDLQQQMKQMQEDIDPSNEQPQGQSGSSTENPESPVLQQMMELQMQNEKGTEPPYQQNENQEQSVFPSGQQNGQMAQRKQQTVLGEPDFQSPEDQFSQQYQEQDQPGVSSSSKPPDPQKELSPPVQQSMFSHSIVTSQVPNQMLNLTFLPTPTEPSVPPYNPGLSDNPNIIHNALFFNSSAAKGLAVAKNLTLQNGFESAEKRVNERVHHSHQQMHSFGIETQTHHEQDLDDEDVGLPEPEEEDLQHLGTDNFLGNDILKIKKNDSDSEVGKDDLRQNEPEATSVPPRRTVKVLDNCSRNPEKVPSNFQQVHVEDITPGFAEILRSLSWDHSDRQLKETVTTTTEAVDTIPAAQIHRPISSNITNNKSNNAQNINDTATATTSTDARIIDNTISRLIIVTKPPNIELRSIVEDSNVNSGYSANSGRPPYQDEFLSYKYAPGLHYYNNYFGHPGPLVGVL